MTNFEDWVNKQPPLTEDTFVDYYDKLTWANDCGVCPLPTKCEYISDDVCRANFREFARMEIKEITTITNLEQWAAIQESSALTEDDFAEHYNKLTHDKGCPFCPLPVHCEYISDDTCKLLLREFAKMQVEDK